MRRFLVLVARQHCREEVDSFDEVVGSDGQQEVDGIEVGLAGETAAEVRSGIDCRAKFLAPRT